MGDSVQRRRPPLRGDKEKMETPENIEDVQEEVQPCDVDFKVDSSVLQILLDNKSMKGNVQDALKKVVDYFEQLNTFQKRLFLTTTFILSLESRECCNVVAALYGLLHTKKVEGDTVRTMLLTTIQKELEVNDYQHGHRIRFLNAVSLLSEMYYQIRFDDQPISVLGGELLKYFRWLLSGGEKELEVLAVGLMVNGGALKKDKPASYRKLLMDVRKALVSRSQSILSRSFLLLIVDMDNSNFKPLPEELLIYHMTYVGDDIFQRFSRPKPSLTASAISKTTTSDVWEEYSVRQPSPVRPRSKDSATSPDRRHSPDWRHATERRHSPDRRHSPERHHTPERRHSFGRRIALDRRHSFERRRSPDRRRSPMDPRPSDDRRPCDEPRRSPERRPTFEKRHSTEGRKSPASQLSADDRRPTNRDKTADRRMSAESSFDSSRSSSKVGHRGSDSSVRPQKTEGFSRGRVFQNSSNSSSSAWGRNDRWSDPPTAGFESTRNDRKSSWYNEHDDRFDRDYGV